MKPFVKQLALYQQYHTKGFTKLTHVIGVPFLVFAALIFLGWFHLSLPKLFETNLAWVVVIAVIIYYFFLDALLAAGVAVILLLLTFLSQFFSQPQINVYGVTVFVIFFVIGIAAQAIGHIYEKKKPTFWDGFSFVVLAPLFLFAELMFALGYREDLRFKKTQL